MPTTGKIRSNAIGIYISNESANSGTFTGGTYGDNTSENDTWEIVACATSGTFSGSMDVIDATTKDNDGLREILTSSLSWSMNCDGLIEYGLGSSVRSSPVATLRRGRRRASGLTRASGDQAPDGSVVLGG